MFLMSRVPLHQSVQLKLPHCTFVSNIWQELEEDLISGSDRIRVCKSNPIGLSS